MPPSLAIALGALAVALLRAAPASADVNVRVDGEAVNLVPPPVVQAGRVLVPLRGVFERLGASVVYENGTIDATGRDGRDISLHIGSTQATVDGRTRSIDVAPFIIGASTYVPLRFVSEALGASVDWDEAEQVVSIATGSGEPEANPVAEEPPAVTPEDASYAPPPLPDYDQPEVPAPNEIWQPGYWAFGPYGYFWVPGTWVAPPQTGYLWTPGYWVAQNGRFHFNQGFWAVAVGFYGGLDYGGGYFGHGYDGGRWSGRRFVYNTYVTHVNVTIVRTTYVDRTVYVERPGPRVAYDGGPHGVAAVPTAREAVVARAPHLAITLVQRQHILAAGTDRRQLAGINHGKPPAIAVVRPLGPANPPAGIVPVKAADRIHVETAPVATHPIVTQPDVTHPSVPTPRATRSVIRPQVIVPPVERAEPVRSNAPAVAPPVRRVPLDVPEPVIVTPHPAVRRELVRPEVVRPETVRPLVPATPYVRARVVVPPDAVILHTAPAPAPFVHAPVVRPVPPRPTHVPHVRATRPPGDGAPPIR